MQQDEIKKVMNINHQLLVKNESLTETLKEATWLMNHYQNGREDLMEINVEYSETLMAKKESSAR